MEVSPEPAAVRVKPGARFTVRLNTAVGGTSIRRWYLAFRSTPETRKLPGFDVRDWGAILHDADGDGVFEVSTEGWKPGHYVLECTVDDWPEGATRAKDTISVTVGGDE